MTHALGRPVWVDIGTSDIPAAVAFYGELFGWTYEEFGPEGGGYGQFRKDGKQVAGIGPATDEARGSSWALYLATDDTAQTAAQVEANGGQVVMAPMEVMDQGSMAVFTDPAGAFFSVWQPGKHVGSELFGVPGSLGWADLYTPDVAAVKPFYTNVFGMSYEDVTMGTEPYTIFSVGGEQVGGFFTPPGGADMPSYWLPYFHVGNVDSALDGAVARGATEMMRGDYPGGRLGILSDPQGATLGILT
jgi:predicted enzyme related to lactoylglutathione lyase